MQKFELICIGSDMYGVPCKSRCTGEDDYCDLCRLADAGSNIQSIHSGFSGIFANIAAMRAAGDAVGIDAVMTDLANIMQRIQHMQDAFQLKVQVELRAA